MNNSSYEAVIGLEIHCQLSTRSKLFCCCPTEFGASPNSYTCDVCLGLPGALPVLNKEAVVKAVKLAVALNGNIQELSFFDRKQYFYQDLPKGYQISQFNVPYCLGGELTISEGKLVRLRRIHIEEDAGKSFHRDRNTAIDLNRAGIPLVEIVTEPDFRTASEAVDFFKKLQKIVVHIGISDGIMEEGSLRCDANISVRKKGVDSLGTRCEVKNLNSFRFLEKAIDYEIFRQIEVIQSNGSVTQETRLYDDVLDRTFSMRAKENSHDYRYFYDPDLRPLIIKKEWVQFITKTIPEMPEEKRQKFISFNLSPADVEIIINEPNLCAYFEHVLDISPQFPNVSPKMISQWVIREILAEGGHIQNELDQYRVEPRNILELISLVADEIVTMRVAQTVFQKMLETGEKPLQIVEKENLKQVTNEAEIIELIEAIINQNPKQVAEYVAGKDKVLAFFVGQVMRASHGVYRPNMVNEIVKKLLDARKN
jgi:aspartyl-tRNA(Asn)/glutamyl-tRNA(Gln) amidotransferase subunit B